MTQSPTLRTDPVVVSTATEPVVSPRSFGRAALVAGIAVVVIAGLLVRVWAVGRQPVNGDVAIVGLMAHEILRGHFFAFYWGQRYGGGEPYVVAVLFAIFGQSTMTLGMVPVLLDAVAGLLIWRIGVRLSDQRVGVLAALLFWIWPEAYVWQSTMEYGFRWLALDCGLGLALIGLRLATGPQSFRAQVRDFTLFGLLLGVGWWCSPEIVYYALPIVVVLATSAQRSRLLRPSALLGAVLAALLGALPWLWANLRSGFRSFHSGPIPHDSFVFHLGAFFGHALPMLLGLQLRISGNWLIDPTFGQAIYSTDLLAIALCLIVLVRERRGGFLVLFMVATPIVYALSPYNWYWADGRYAIYFAPVLSLVAGFGVFRLGSWIEHRASLGALRRVIAWSLPVVLVIAAGTLSVVAMHRLAPYRPQRILDGARPTWTAWQSNPDIYLDALLATLDARQIHDVYAGYWIAGPLQFESHGGVLASDIVFVRYEPYLQGIESSSRPTWLFINSAHRTRAAAEIGSRALDPGCVAGLSCISALRFEQYLTSAKDRFSSSMVGDFVLVRPRRAIAPTQLISYFHLVA